MFIAGVNSVLVLLTRRAKDEIIIVIVRSSRAIFLVTRNTIAFTSSRDESIDSLVVSLELILELLILLD